VGNESRLLIAYNNDQGDIVRSEITVIFDAKRSVNLQADVEPTPEQAEAARRWFDQTWESLGCEPLRPSGKVLLLDKVMGVADALGYTVLASQDARSVDFAEQLTHALGRQRVTVDLPGLTVGY